MVFQRWVEDVEGLLLSSTLSCLSNIQDMISHMPARHPLSWDNERIVKSKQMSSLLLGD